MADLNHHLCSAHEGKKSAKKVEKLEEKSKDLKDQLQLENSNGKKLMIEDSKIDLKHEEEFRTETKQVVHILSASLLLNVCVLDKYLIEDLHQYQMGGKIIFRDCRY